VLDEVEASGASLLAISPELPCHSVELIGSRGLRFEILRDELNELGAALGLRFELPEELRTVYRVFGIDLEAFNGEPSWALSMPARYVVDADGVIRQAAVHADYTRRPDPSETLAALRS
jgi:peroxiredoxin